MEGPAGAKNGRQFLKELKTGYRKLRGVRWWFSLTDLARIKIVKFVRLLDDREIVVCSPEPVSIGEIRSTPGYEISIDGRLDDKSHIAWAEGALVVCLQSPSSLISDDEVNAIIAGLPKQKDGSLDRKGRSFGYGMRPGHGWSLLKLLCLFGFCLVMGLVFFCAWLAQHPGDLQGASVIYFMMLAAPTAVVGVVDRYMV